MNEERLAELLEAYLDGALTADEAQELRQLVESEPAARARFLAEARWSLELGARLQPRAVPLASRVAALIDAVDGGRRVASAVVRRISSRRRAVSAAHRRFRASPAAPWWLAVAACLLVAIGLSLRGQPAKPSPTIDPSGVATASGEGGRIERAGASLRLSDERESPLAIGDRLVADETGLTVRFPDGSAVDLTEVGSLVVRAGVSQGAKQIDLERGSLQARVAHQRPGEALIIVSPQARVTVIGTVFTLAVEEGGTRLAVLDGRVAMAPAAGGAGVEVAAGHSALAGTDGRVALVGEPVATPAIAISERFGPTGGRPFAAGSPWNRPIPRNPALDAHSADIAGGMGGQRAAVALYKYAVPIYDADAATPVREVLPLRPGARSLFTGFTVRVPDGVIPNAGHQALVVLDWSARRTWEFHEFAWDGDAIRSGGGQISLDGNGADKPTPGYSGASMIAGLVRLREIAQGRIPHALAFGTSFAQLKTFRFPSNQSDGKRSGPDAIPVGARIQLDPTLAIDAIPGITPGEKAIAQALQTYGAYCVGNSGQPMLFFCELARDAVDQSHPGAVYTASGLAGDAADLGHIPFSSLRVLKQWDGGGGDPLP